MTCLSAAARYPLLAIVWLLLVSGCRQQPPRFTYPVQATEPPEQFTIKPYLDATRLGRWTYIRTAGDDDKAIPYLRIFCPDRLLEGMLATREFLPIERYLERDTPASRPAQEVRPKAPLEGGTAFLFRLAQPMEPFPESLVPGLPIVDSSPIVYYEYNGRRLSGGTLTRTALVEGFEAVDTPGGRFDDCVRVRVDLTVHIPWTLKLEWTSYVWLAAEMGEVRRVEQMSGWFLVFWFAGEHEYQLLSGQPALEPPEPQAMRPPLWRSGAVVMTRVVPKPEIGGLVVDYSLEPRPSTRPATAPAGGEPAETVSAETLPAEIVPVEPGLAETGSVETGPAETGLAELEATGTESAGLGQSGRHEAGTPASPLPAE